MPLDHAEIPLSNSPIMAQVDLLDAKWALAHSWYLTPHGFAARDVEDLGFIYLHDEVLFRHRRVTYLPIKRKEQPGYPKSPKGPRDTWKWE